MSTSMRLYDHQRNYLYAPELFPEKRYIFFCAGYAAGKTRADVVSVIYWAKRLQRVKDQSGDYARLMVSGYTLKHLEETFLIYFRNWLDISRTPYTEDKKNNIFTIGTVKIILMPFENPDSIFGQDVFAIWCVAEGSMIDCEGGLKPIEHLKQGDRVWTRKGLMPVKRLIDRGIKPVMKINGLCCTPDHRIWCNGEWTNAEDIKIGDSLFPFQHTETIEKDCGEKRVYDITVEGEHEFYANGLLVHNCDEIDEASEDKSIEAVKSLSQRCRQQIKGQRSPFMCFSSTSQGEKGLYRIYTQFKKTGVGFVLIRGSTYENLSLTPEYVRDLEKMFTEPERKVYLEGQFLPLATGRVIPDFDWNRNYIPEPWDRKPRSGETVFVGMDFNVGFSRAGAYIIREEPGKDAAIYCIKRYDFPNAQNAPDVFRHDFPNQKILWIPDVTAKDSFPQFGRALRKHDIHIIFRKKSPLVEDTVFLVNKLLYTGRLIFTEMAKEAAEACALAMRDKATNKIPAGKTRNSPIHDVDHVRYVCAFIAANRKEFRDMRRLVLDRRASFREESEEMVRALDSGYSEISPALYA